MRAQRNREAHFARACAMETHMDMSQKPFCVEVYRKNAGPEARKMHAVWKFTGETPDPKPARDILCGNLQEKCRTPIPWSMFCARLRHRNAHGHVTKSHSV